MHKERKEEKRRSGEELGREWRYITWIPGTEEDGGECKRA